MDAAEPVALLTPHRQISEEEKPAEAHATRFLEFIFHGITQGFVEIRYLGAGRRPKIIDKPIFIPLPIDQTSFVNQAVDGDKAQMVAVGLAPRYRIPQGGRQGKDRDVLQISCLWVHLDYSSVEGGAIEVSKRLRGFPLRPSMTVNTGLGRQSYYVMNEPFSDGRLLDWDNLIRGLRDAMGGVYAINVAQSFLLPGSVNLEDPRTTLSCRLDEEDSSWVRYGVEELKDAIRSACELRQSKSRVAQIGIAPANLQERGVPQDIIDAISTGRLTQSGNTPFVESRDSQGRDLSIVLSLLDSGFEKEEIKSLFRSHPNGCGRKFVREIHGERYLEFTLRTAFQLRRRLGHSDRVSDDDERVFELPVGYELDRDGSLWFRPAAADGERKPPKPVKVSSSYIGIAGISENVDTSQVSLTVEYEYLGQPRRRVITRSQMANARQLVATLAGEGAPVTSNNARHVTSYLAAFEHACGASLPRRKVTSRFGRGNRNGPFFLPGAVPNIDFAPEGEGDAALFRAYASRRGSLRGWLDMSRVLAEEKLLIPQIAILACFVPPLQAKLRISNFILDLHGATSTGKSTSLKLAASVYGSSADPDSMVMQWMNTQAAVEQLAGVCSELPIFLDDAQHCQDELKRSIIYMIGNGRGKGRSSRNGGTGGITTWHTVALSTSEEPLHESSPHEGARGRILPMGGSTQAFPSGAASLVHSVERAAAENHGYAGEAYVRHLNNWTSADWSRQLQRLSIIHRELLKSSGSNLTDRVSGYIAAIQLGGEIACPLLGLPFKPEVLSAWLMTYLTEQQDTQNHVLHALRVMGDYYVKNLIHFAGDGGNDPEKPGAIFGSSKKHEYVGFMRSTLDDMFRPQKWNQTAILNKMAEACVLLATEEERHTKKVCVRGVKHRMVCVKWSAIFPGDVST